MADSRLELLLAEQIRTARLPRPEREHQFFPGRRWRFDFAWPDRLIAAEVEGGIWTHGRHSRGAGFEKDCEKYNSAALVGWRVFRFTGGMLNRNEAIPVLQDALDVGLAAVAKGGWGE